MGNFKELLDFRASAGDELLKEHLVSFKKNASYISKTSQNELLFCLSTCIQEKIEEQLRSKQVGPYYGFQCDEVKNASNWEQLGLVFRYLTNGKPTERLLEFIDCEEVTVEAICDSIIIKVLILITVYLKQWMVQETWLAIIQCCKVHGTVSSYSISLLH